MRKQSVFLLLLVILSTARSDDCFCATRNKVYPFTDVVRIDTYEGIYVNLQCCAREMLQHLSDTQFERSDVTITWSFNGSPYPWTTEDNFDTFCYPQELLIKSPSLADAGNYTCSYHVAGVGVIERVNRLKVHKRK